MKYNTVSVDHTMEEEEEVPDLIPHEVEQPMESQNSTEEDTTGSLSEKKKIVPVTILSGFLGAGKTTLIQYILSSPNHGKRIAVIENEFAGDNDNNNNNNNNRPLEIESLIARDYNPTMSGSNNKNNENLLDLIELPNGCICCTVKDSLVTTLEALLQRQNNNNTLDYILIEASGMANPGPIASIFWLDEALESQLSLNGIVTLVDSYHILQQLETTSSKNNNNGGDEAAQQIAFADRILLNKLDLIHNNDNKQHQAGNDYLQTIISSIRTINSTAPIQTTTYSQVPDLDWIFQAQSLNVDRYHDPNVTDLCTEPNCMYCVPTTKTQMTMNDASRSKNNMMISSELCFPCHEEDTTATARSSTNVVDDHRHTSAITSITLQEQASVSLEKIKIWLATICWPGGEQDEDEAILKEQLIQLEEQNVITTPQLQHQLLQNKRSSMEIFRIKGILSVDDDDSGRKFIVQAVHDLWDVYASQSEALIWKPDEVRCCKIVLIGRNLNLQTLKEGFQSCCIIST